MWSRSNKIMSMVKNNDIKSYYNAHAGNNEPNNEEIIPKNLRPDSVASTSKNTQAVEEDLSNSSPGPSYYEDTDDSVEDPDFQIQKNITIEASSSDEEEHGYINEERVLNRNVLTASNKISHEIQLNNVQVDQNVVTDNMQGIENLPFQPSRSQDNTSNITDSHEIETPTKKGRKRPRNETKWKRNINKELRNSGKSYVSLKTNKTILERQQKGPCAESCKYKCGKNFTEAQRTELYTDYWNLGNIEQQWSFIANSVEPVAPTYRYVRVDSEGKIMSKPKRECNNAYYFTLSGTKIRVCKVFFMNTLGINTRPIETALKKKSKTTNISLMKDNRGQHRKQPKVDDSIKKGVKQFIEAIPRIESHYIRAHSTKEYIDGAKTVADIHRDYVEHCKKNSCQYANYIFFYRIFTTEYNISFFTPKKDLCEDCEAYKNCSDQDKEARTESHERHLKEKELSRKEKERDKLDKNVVVAVYDLQAVHQCPKGDVSVFYYKSKLNVLNLSIYDLHKNTVDCFVWDESNANRGVNEIGTCIYRYLEKISSKENDVDVIFYSDNCAGQQKNKFMMSMYLFAVQKLPNIKSITHKFLIKGHTQNEGDSAHSQIERQVKRQLRSGPMYTPDAFINAIKAARKKSEPFKVHEICFDDILDWKNVCKQMGFNITKDEDDEVAKTSEMKVIKVVKNEPRLMFFKTSFADDQFKKAVVIKKRKEIEIVVNTAFQVKPGISEAKKNDLMELVNKNHIPRYYRPFFEAL